MTEPKDKLSSKQLGVIDDLVGGEMDEKAVLAVHRVSMNDYGQWLEQTDFTALLQFRLDTMRRSAILLIAAYAPKAAETLLVLTRDKKPEVARRACLDILTMPQALSDAGNEAPDKATIEPHIDTQTAAEVLAAMAQVRRKTK
ncbi:MAG: hypothetical protein J7M40_19115 [Planctomycetes bacterium]|nr:hypothetical protein [Planctomycetota bacterium]